MPVDFLSLAVLKYPQDASQIKKLDLLAKQLWYSTQDPREMIFLGQNREFVRFWYFTYILPLNVKRLLFKVKRIFQGHW